MPPIGTLMLYVPAVLLLVVTPGPAILLTLNRSLAFGRHAGFATAAGLLTGTSVLQLCAALGLTVILRASETAYDAVKLAGALYLLYLGIRAIAARSNEFSHDPSAGPRLPGRTHYLAGIATELLNPKTAMFYVSVLPQFVDVGAGRAAAQMLVLGAIFTVFAAGSLTAIVLSSVRVRSVLARRPGLGVFARRLTGCVLIGFGARLALERR